VGRPRGEERWRADGRCCWSPALANYLTALDSSIVAFGLPSLGRAFEVGPNDALWVSLVRVLGVTGLTLTLGRVGDLYGRKRLFVGGLALFCTGVSLSAAAPTLPALLAARAVESVGAAMVLANLEAIAADAFPAGERGRAIGILDFAIGAGLTSGPVLGGLLIEVVGWRATFLPQIPISAAGAVLGWWVLSDPPRPSGRRRVDVVGAALLFLALGAFVLAVNRGGTWGWLSAPVLGLGALTLVCLAALVPWETRTPSPVLRPSLFRRRSLSAGTAGLVLYYIAITAPTFLVPFYLIGVLGWGHGRAGLVAASTPLVLLILSPFSGRWSDRVGARSLTAWGMALIATGLAWLTTLDRDAGVLTVVARLIVVGAGSALFLTPNNSALLGAVPHPYRGTASALIATGRNIGLGAGYAIAGAVMVEVATRRAGLHAAGAGLDPALVPPADLLDGIRAALLVAAAIGLAGIIASYLRGEPAPEDEPVATPADAAPP
jgi:EmrB/QacA subfamily drug resistance transporter